MPSRSSLICSLAFRACTIADALDASGSAVERWVRSRKVGPQSKVGTATRHASYLNCRDDELRIAVHDAIAQLFKARMLGIGHSEDLDSKGGEAPRSGLATCWLSPPVVYLDSSTIPLPFLTHWGA
eukprot:scaffold4278_cov263-Pinguiococcus_pyrenoidosus.AAC.4